MAGSILRATPTQEDAVTRSTDPTAVSQRKLLEALANLGKSDEQPVEVGYGALIDLQFLAGRFAQVAIEEGQPKLALVWTSLAQLVGSVADDIEEHPEENT